VEDIRGGSILKEADRETTLTGRGSNGDEGGKNRCGERRFGGRCRQYALGMKWGCLRALWSGRRREENGTHAQRVKSSRAALAA
jgi:hypothetical protein